MAKRARSIVGQDPAVASVFLSLVEGVDASFYRRPINGFLVVENDFRAEMARFRLVCKNFNAVADQVIAENKEKAPFADYLSGEGAMNFSDLLYHLQNGVTWPLETRVRLLRDRCQILQVLDGKTILDACSRCTILREILGCNFPGQLRRAQAAMRFWNMLDHTCFIPCGDKCKGYAGVFEDDPKNPPCFCICQSHEKTFAMAVGGLDGSPPAAAHLRLEAITSISCFTCISFCARIGAAKLVSGYLKSGCVENAVYLVCMVGTPDVVRTACENKAFVAQAKKDRGIPSQLPCSLIYRGVGATVQVMTILADAGIDYAGAIDFVGCGVSPDGATRSATYLHYMKLRDEQAAYVRANSS